MDSIYTLWSIIGYGQNRSIRSWFNGGFLFGNSIDDHQFKISIAVLVIMGIGLMIWLDFRKQEITVPDHWIVASILGMARGFTSMMGNAAAPIFTLCFLSMRLPKKEFIRKGFWFY